MAIQDSINKRTGKNSFFIYRNQRIPITRISLRVIRTLADCTDSLDYDGNADMIGPTQLPVSAQIEGTVEGRFNVAVIPQTIFGDLFTGVFGVPCTLSVDANTPIGSGYVDISDYTQDMPVNDVVNFSCTVRSNGLFSIN